MSSLPKLPRNFIILATALLSTSGTAMASQSLTYLREVPGTQSSFPHDINNFGVSVGITTHATTHQNLPVQWINDQPQLLSLTQSGEARSINDAGVIAGHLEDASGARQPVIWRDGVAEILDAPVAETARYYGGVANDLNEAGHVVGWTIVDGLTRATVWRNGTPSLLPGLADDLPTFATTIDNEGNIYGIATEPLTHSVVGVRWTNGQITRLVSSFADQARVQLTYPTDSGGGRVAGYTHAESVIVEADRFFTFQPNDEISGFFLFTGNARGEFAGFYQASNGLSVPIMATPEGFSRIPFDDSQSAFASGMNETGKIVGYHFPSDTAAGGPVLWDMNHTEIVRMSNMSALPGQSVRMVARVMRGAAPVRGRTVRFQLGSQLVGNAVTDSSGVASMWMTIPTTTQTGTHEIMGSLGGSNYVKRRLVVGMPSTGIGISGFSTRPGRTHLLTARLWNFGLDRPLAGKTVSFRIGRTVVGTAVTDSSGRARLTYTIPTTHPVGAFDYVARFEGDATHRRSQGSSILRITR